MESLFRFGASLVLLRAFMSAREIDLKGGAQPNLTVDPDVTARLLNYPVDCGESETGSLADFLRGEERLEDARFCQRVDTDAGIAHGQHHKGAGADADVLRGILLIEIDILSLDG